MSTATVIIIAAIFLIVVGLGALIIFLVLRRRPSQAAQAKETHIEPPKHVVKTTAEAHGSSPLVFHFSYVTAPLIIAVVCIILALAFFAFLPNPLAFRFSPGGSVLTTMNKYVFVTIMAGLQTFSVLAAIAIAQTIVMVSRKILKASQPTMQLDGFVALMSNMVLLPQVILAYLMLDAFIYGVWSLHLISMRNFAFTAVIIGSAILFTIFIRLASRARGSLNKQ